MALDVAPALAEHTDWLLVDDQNEERAPVDGLVLVEDFVPGDRTPEEVAVMEKAAACGARAVFFEAPRNERAPVAQAFIFDQQDGFDEETFPEIHKRLWSWGGVPLAYLAGPGLVRLFRCAHKPDFSGTDGQLICNPIRTLRIGAEIAASDIWWDAAHLRSGTIWDDPAACRLMLSAKQSAHRTLVETVRGLADRLSDRNMLAPRLRRRLLILSLLIAYLEERRVLLPSDFGEALSGASQFFEVLRDGPALVGLLGTLEARFNGHVFRLSFDEREALITSEELGTYARLVEAHEDVSGQLSFWKLYSFADLPVELISNIYQLFVADTASSIYTPPALVRLMLEEALGWERLDELMDGEGVILDPACGSGVFLVEAYKRLVLHWRLRNDWQRPDVDQLRCLLTRIHGVDLEEGAVELAAFSLCLSLCDALEPADIRSSVKLFPQLAGTNLHQSCFFHAKEEQQINVPVTVIVGNPPFVSSLTTPAAKRSYDKYKKNVGHLADKQLAYLFLHEAMDMLAEGGILAMVSPAGFLYNQKALPFRNNFFETWRVREILDFVSVRGLFQADPKVIVVISEKSPTNADAKILHAIFRRNGRAAAEQGFQIDRYDLNWMTNSEAKTRRDIWRANLLGGDRVCTFVERLRSFRTLRDVANERDWDFGEGFIAGKKGISNPADHLIGKPLLQTSALSVNGLDAGAIEVVPDAPVKDPKSEKRFKPPLLLVKEHQDLHAGIWTGHYLTFKDKIVGFAAPSSDRAMLESILKWIEKNRPALSAYIAGVSASLFTQRATAILSADILALPYPEDGNLDLSENEWIIAEDIVEFQRDFIRLGAKSAAMKTVQLLDLEKFDSVLTRQIGTVYPERPLRAHGSYRWSGAVCQAYSFGDAEVDWSGADELRGKIGALLADRSRKSLDVTRIVRLYDGQFLFLLKSDRLRFWLRSMALRDADDVLADLRYQGF
tara:strand:+ start:67328 stop:70192 length:2865 start_codon:yes stop_codon:yes gene_type:complete